MTKPNHPLELDAVSVNFGSLRAVDNVSLTVERGTIHALLGPNGAGKSTTIAASVGLLKPTSGHARIFGYDPVKEHTHSSALAGVMLQDGGLPMASKPLNILKNLSRMYADPADYHELAERLGITAFADRTIRRMSGGQKQRVGMAAALIGKPQLVFLDEPTAGLDPQSRLAVFTIVEELREQGVAVVLTTHDMDDAAHLSDYVTIIDKGHVISHGTVGELTGDGSSTLTIRARHLGQNLLDQFRAYGEVDLAKDGAVTITGDFTTQTVHAITGLLNDAGADITSLSLASRSLDDVFLDLTGRTLRS
ncbi:MULTISPECIES: ABC transporter ATP-binding protein [Brevibacterium]|uniref:ABC transporter ATP-binding protein n=1 Tax=Brevibacterium paucivorans TaxID=170994 RepID=A0A2N6VQH0_9MICO|nr:ABC transporter ATP-binding protein [Brevibacterium paucivorans]MCG7299642.1 ABC transporter ATP-binding protein [Brevibacterium sp. ACRRH]PMD06382.1 ABC transporter ATP-binding protein [Brevibacterium paucivorans]